MNKKMIKLTSIVNDILKDNITENLLNDSIKFNWQNKKYYWVDDKKGMNMDTSMTTKDDNDKTKYSFTEYLLPRSGVMSYNLFNIKNFYVTQALKHNRVTRYLNPDEKEFHKTNKIVYDLTPDESIEEFKNFTAKYIVKILISKGFDIDAILTPQSSSNFNPDMINRVAQFYQKATGKKILTVPNAFVKSPKDIKIDNKNIKSNLSQEVEKYFKPNAPADEVEKYVKFKIIDLNKEIGVWKIEEDIKPVMMSLYNLWNKLESTREQKIWSKTRNKTLFDISMQIRNILQRIEDTFGGDFRETKYFIKGDFHPEAVLNPWQIKHLSDGIRKSIYNIFKLTDQLDVDYNYQDKKNNTVYGVSTLINRLARNNKTILIFDDNLSSGATLDDASYHLISNGIKKENIVAITLGKVPLSNYNREDLRRASNISDDSENS